MTCSPTSIENRGRISPSKTELLLRHELCRVLYGLTVLDPVARTVKRRLRLEVRQLPHSDNYARPTRIRPLPGLSGLDQQVVADARSGWNEPLVERLRVEILQHGVEGERGPR